jgi:hypothetical protein
MAVKCEGRAVRGVGTPSDDMIGRPAMPGIPKPQRKQKEKAESRKPDKKLPA